MRRYVSNFSLSILLFFIFIISASLVLALLSYNKLITMDLTNLVVTITSIIVCFVIGLIFGRLAKKRGLLNGLVLASAFGLFLLLYYGLDERTWDISNILINGGRILVIITGTIVGVNTARR